MNSSYGSPFGASYGNGDSQRQSYAQSPPHNNGFSVAGMSGLGQGGSPLSSSQWGASTSGPGLGGSLTESRSHYTAGYIMVRLSILFAASRVSHIAATSAELC